MLRLFSAILALVVFASASGAAELLHEHEHAGVRDASAVLTSDAPHALGDADHCVLCAVLHAPAATPDAAPTLAGVGELVGVVAPTASASEGFPSPLRLACRGPPSA